MSEEMEKYIMRFGNVPAIMYGIDEESAEFKEALAKAVKDGKPITPESYEEDEQLRGMTEGVTETKIKRRRKG